MAPKASAARKKARAAAAKPRSAAAGKAPAAPAGATDDAFFVHETTYPSGRGCYAGARMSNAELDARTTCTKHGPYATEAEAVAKARALRDSTPQFEDWAEEHYGHRPPPYESVYGENDDEDENVTISVVRASDQKRAAAAELSKLGAKPPPAAPSVSKPGAIGLDPSLKPTEDKGLFVRHPAPAVLGGRRTPPSAFPPNFVYCIQRLSDLCHSVAAYAARPSLGARYSLKKLPRVLSKALVWVPPPGYGRGGEHAPPAEALVDCVTTDLTDPSNGDSLLTADSLLAAACAQTRVFFCNNFKQPDSLAAAIGKCGELTTVCLVECTLSEAVVRALAAKGASVRALHLHMCGFEPRAPAECAAWVQMLRAMPELIWLSVCFAYCAPFGVDAIEALPPSLHALAYEVSRCQPPAAHVEALRGSAKRLPLLRWLHVTPDAAGKSAVPLKR